MTWRLRLALGLFIAIGAVFLFTILIGDSTVALFQPRGVIAAAERDVILHTVLTMLVLAIPMLITLFAVVWVYRAERGRKFTPKQTGGTWAQVALWILPAIIVAALFGVTWKSSHALDPYKQIHAEAKPITIQVIALRWKWLFIYPEQHIATINQIAFPANTPVHFDLTADGPVSAFWIPQLGSQMYAMGAMQTQLNLMATEQGEHQGKAMEINGEGYSGMTFTAKSVSDDEFNRWVQESQQSPQMLDAQTYAALAEPSTNNPPAVYASADPNLFQTVMMKDMMPGM